MTTPTPWASLIFLSTLSLRRATQQAIKAEQTARISIHALLAESDKAKTALYRSMSDFYPRSPCGERLCGLTYLLSVWNFYPRSPCGERHTQGFPALHHIFISIHALLAESDWNHHARPVANTISIHALLAESDIISIALLILPIRFLSTLSLRRATNDAINGCNPDFISIHALLAESDRNVCRGFAA